MRTDEAKAYILFLDRTCEGPREMLVDVQLDDEKTRTKLPQHQTNCRVVRWTASRTSEVEAIVSAVAPAGGGDISQLPAPIRDRVFVLRDQQVYFVRLPSYDPKARRVPERTFGEPTESTCGPDLPMSSLPWGVRSHLDEACRFQQSVPPRS